MATTQPIRNRIQDLKRAYDTLRQGKESLLSMIDEVEDSRECVQLERD